MKIRLKFQHPPLSIIRLAFQHRPLSLICFILVFMSSILFTWLPSSLSALSLLSSHLHNTFIDEDALTSFPEANHLFYEQLTKRASLTISLLTCPILQHPFIYLVTSQMLKRAFLPLHSKFAIMSLFLGSVNIDLPLASMSLPQCHMPLWIERELLYFI